MRKLLLGLGIAISMGIFTAGCVVTAEPATYGSVVYDEPPPDQRVYIYDPGYPPGSYYYNGDIYYEDHAYHRDVFVDHFVDVNLRDHRYVDRDENRRSAITYVNRDSGRYQTAHPAYRRPADNHPELHRSGPQRGDDRHDDRGGRQ